jgi:hypothetical protein
VRKKSQGIFSRAPHSNRYCERAGDASCRSPGWSLTLLSPGRIKGSNQLKKFHRGMVASQFPSDIPTAASRRPAPQQPSFSARSHFLGIEQKHIPAIRCELLHIRRRWRKPLRLSGSQTAETRCEIQFMTFNLMVPSDCEPT